MAKSTNFYFIDGKTMTLNDQVALALRRLSSGESLIAVGDSFGTNHSTVSQVTWRFVEAVEESGLHHLKWPTDQEMAQIKSNFENIRGLPNCCGSIATTHVTMLLASSNQVNDTWRDRNGNHSMILQVNRVYGEDTTAIVDPNMRFRDVVTGWPGKMSEWSVLKNSSFFKLCERGERLNGGEIKLSEGTGVREYIVGGSGFPLLPWLLTPYKGTELRGGVGPAGVDFNKRHLVTRAVAERALGRLKEEWRMIQGEMWRPDKHKLPRIILACCILHNIIIDMEEENAVLDDEELTLTHPRDKGYRKEVCELVDERTKILRDQLALYLSGRLPP
ncbi:hypothetical protein LguiA_021003 [Lonicera macranthoides]